MSEVLTERWLWIIIITVCLVIATPLAVVWVILNLPFPFNTIAIILLVVLWGVVAGYKEWVIEKRKEKEEELAKKSS
jgi:amino acid transporter